ncbi:hypothetical protein CEP82_001100 [Mobiluncus mulieris]|nr:hypothetical protein CEP82_001100 [Mobiluncus mulieris]
MAGLAIAVAVGGHQSRDVKTRGTPPGAGFPHVLSFQLGFRGFHGVTPGLFWAVTRLTRPGKPRTRYNLGN